MWSQNKILSKTVKTSEEAWCNYIIIIIMIIIITLFKFDV